MQRSFVMNRPRDVEQSWTCVSLRRYRFREEELAITSSPGSRYLVISPCYNYTYHRGAVARLRRSYNKDVRFSHLSSRRHGEAVDEIGASDRENFQPRIFTEGVSTLLPFSVRKTRRRGGKKTRQRTRVVWTCGGGEAMESLKVRACTKVRGTSKANMERARGVANGNRGARNSSPVGVSLY